MNVALLWARRWAQRPAAADHELLEISAVATLETVRAAYHKLARFAHPDLHRAAVSAAELDEITETFARVSNAYSVLSAQLRRASAGASPPRASTASPSAVTEKMPRFTAPSSRMTSAPPVGPSAMPPSSSTGPATGLSSKAMLHSRRAELCQRRGEVVEARLHLKLALAAEPQSAFLRRALEELDRG